MHYLIATLISSAFILSTSKTPSSNEIISSPQKKITKKLKTTNEPFVLLQGSSERKTAVEFKNQKYCRVELKDFDFDAKFTIISATVYFAGANFYNVQMRNISSNSLQPIEDLQKRCIPGTIVTFDNVKVKGPDNEIRTIAGVTYILY